MSDEVGKVAEALAKQAPIKELYEDLAHAPITEAGKALTDVAKAARLLLAPVQILAAYQVRFERFVKRIADKVPEAHRIEVHPTIAGPILETLRYAPEEEVLTEYMLNLLATAMDSTRVQNAHPAFTGITRQLCSDEAIVLFHLKKTPFRLFRELGYRDAKTKALDFNSFPIERLAQPGFVPMYFEHLKSLNLVEIFPEEPEEMKDGKGELVGIRGVKKVELTQFGELFAKACIPEELPVPLGQSPEPGKRRFSVE